MFRWPKALALGLTILNDVAQLLAGEATSFSFSWQGRSFTVTIAPGAKALDGAE